MRQALILHPNSLCDAVRDIAVDVTRPQPGELVLSYQVTGAIDAIVLPPVATPARTDALWQHTCFEAFLRSGDEEGYLEFNFAPSTEWAAYRFDSYRSAMHILADDAPALEVEAGRDAFELRAALGGLPEGGPWRVGLSCVIEEKSGRKSYWALRHSPGKPDFHHADSFALVFPTTP